MSLTASGSACKGSWLVNKLGDLLDSKNVSTTSESMMSCCDVSPPGEMMMMMMWLYLKGAGQPGNGRSKKNAKP